MKRVKVHLPDIEKRNRYRDNGLKLGTVAAGEVGKSRNGLNHFLQSIKGESKLPLFKRKHLSIGEVALEKPQYESVKETNFTVKQTLLQHHRDLVK